MCFLTIITPTYNRSRTLPRLFGSIVGQGCNDFEWLVVDDGSTDDTASMVNGWIADSPVRIRYIHCSHGGKAKAFNTGVRNTSSPFILLVDSDDYLLPDAVGRIKQDCGCLDADSVAYILYPAKPVQSVAPTFPVEKCDMRRSKLNALCFFETSFVIKSAVIKNYLYPEFDGETYITPSFVFYEMDGEYDCRPLNTPIVEFEYQDDGISRNRWKLKAGNYRGWALSTNQQILYSHGVVAKVKTAGAYFAFALLSGKKQPVFSSNAPLLVLLSVPAGLVYMVIKLLPLRIGYLRRSPKSYAR